MEPAIETELKALSRQKPMNDIIDRGDSIVQQFYNGVTVFITGGSGFIGKQLIEKLFRSCVIKKMFLLMRPKKTTSIQERLDQILSDPVFNLVHAKNPQFSSNIEPVEGDVTKIRMGINDKQWRQLTEEVNVIFHVAATTKFNAPLREATFSNVLGTREALALARECYKCKSFVYISTAYTHAYENSICKEVFEQFRPCPLPPDTLIQLAENMDEDRLNCITENLITGWPNTYTFTKAVAEELIRTSAGDLPICVVRPPIVLSAYCEPAPGWLDVSAVFGPSGLVLGAILGVTRIFLADKSVKLTVTPVDLLNNITIVAPWDAAERRSNGYTNIPVYNATHKNSNITSGQIREVLVTTRQTLCSPKALWYCDAMFTKNHILYRTIALFLHYIPAYLLDKVFDILGKKPKNIKSFVKLYKKLDDFLVIYKHFLNNNWEFQNDNVTSMISRMSDTDQAIFNCDLTAVDMDEYIIIWGIGIRKYIIKDGLTGYKSAARWQLVYLIMNFILLFLIMYLLWKSFSTITVYFT